MPRSYVFTLSPDESGNKSTLEQLRSRLRDGLWPLNSATRHQKHLGEGDRVVVYVPRSAVGLPSRHFVAQMEVAGSRILSGRPAPARVPWAAVSAPVVYDVPIRRVEWFPTPVPLAGLVEDLTFITNKQTPGSNFIGAITLIPEADFDRIVQAAKPLEEA